MFESVFSVSLRSLGGVPMIVEIQPKQITRHRRSNNRLLSQGCQANNARLSQGETDTVASWVQDGDKMVKVPWTFNFLEQLLNLY